MLSRGAPPAGWSYPLLLITTAPLAPSYRLSVEVRFFERHAEEEAAHRAGLSPASDEKRMARALQRMREEL